MKSDTPEPAPAPENPPVSMEQLLDDALGGKVPVSQTPDGRDLWKCSYDSCFRLIPARGWCSRRHADQWKREEGLTFRKRLPESLAVEIRKRGSYWHKEWQRVVGEYVTEMQRRRDAEIYEHRQEQLKAAAEAANATPPAEASS